MTDGQSVYRAELPLANLVRAQNTIAIGPPVFYLGLFGLLSISLNILVVFHLLTMRKSIRTSTLRSSKNFTSERGLALTSVATAIAQMIFFAAFVILQMGKTPAAAALNIIPLVLNSAVPFWVLLASVPTARHTHRSRNSGAPKTIHITTPINDRSLGIPDQSHFQFPRVGMDSERLLIDAFFQNSLLFQ
ncbi:hypothetical protein PENTCL1PPCAC_14805 [Pristionchus entomophagus]|uniref:G protein-coupled receptor n=1 Tax=Pristionchus entomophagus TaxID=358040 RepID=A0AAV5TAR0_9BILA|nr:hypothetical protein PENTCL1PPCAC_14805 [Pristionchus entomophagus]